MKRPFLGLVLLGLVGCGSFVEKKILQEKDYAQWQRDLGARLAHEPQNAALLSELLDIAIINEDFRTVIETSRRLREMRIGDERPLLLKEIAALRHSWQLDACLRQITAYATLYPGDNATGPLLKQKVLIEKSRTLPPPLSISPYSRNSQDGSTYVQAMQAPELVFWRTDETSHFSDLRGQRAVPAKLWETTKTPVPNFEDEIDADILHFPSSADYGRVVEPALPQLRKDSRGISLLHADFSVERLAFLDQECSLPALYPRGDFFVISCPRGNHRDLLLFVRQEHGWKERPLPAGLNTQMDEISPRISPDGKFLFYASDGLPGYGGFDYYYAKIDTSAECVAATCVLVPSFSEPVNFGPQVNTYHNEMYPLNISPLAGTISFSAQGKKNGLTGKAPLPASLRVGETLSYRFVAYQGKNAPALNITLTALRHDTRAPLRLSAGAKADWIRLPAGAEYLVTWEIATGQVSQYRFTVPSLRQNEGSNFRIERFTIEPSPQAIVMTYGEDVTGISAAIRPDLARVADQLKTDARLHALIEGHTDNIGGAAYNQGLSEKRAETMRRQLMSLGIGAERITARGWGETRPLNANATPEERAANRRVEILLVPQ